MIAGKSADYIRNGELSLAKLHGGFESLAWRALAHIVAM